MKYRDIQTYLINGKANGLKVSVEPPLLSPILLHQPYQKGASRLSIHRMIIYILQAQHKLGVGRECGWNTHRSLHEAVSRQSLFSQTHTRFLFP